MERFGLLSMVWVTEQKESVSSQLNKAALSNELRHKNALVQMAKGLTGNLEIHGLFSSVMTHAKELMEVDRSTLFLYDKESHELWSKVADGAEPIRIPAALGIAGAVCMSREVLNIRDAYADKRFNQGIDKQTGYRTKTILAVPIISAGGEMLGVLQLINKMSALNFTEEDVKIANAITSQVAIGISNCLGYEEVAIKHATLTEHKNEMKEILDVSCMLTRQTEFSSLFAAFQFLRRATLVGFSL